MKFAVTSLFVVCAWMNQYAHAQTSAAPSEWKTITVSRPWPSQGPPFVMRPKPVFTFKAPTDLSSVPVQGIDSFVGLYESPSLEVSFDYGSYSDPMEEERYASRMITVDGKSARLVSANDLVAIHFPKLGDNTGLTMVVRLKGAKPELAEMLLRSIYFP